MARPKKTSAAKPKAAPKSKANGKAPAPPSRDEAEQLATDFVDFAYDLDADAEPVTREALRVEFDEPSEELFAAAWEIASARADAMKLFGLEDKSVRTSSAEVRTKAGRRAAEPDPFAGEPDGVAEDDLHDEGDPDEDDDEPDAADADDQEDDDAPPGTEYLLHAFTDAEVLQKRLQRESLDEQIDQLVADQKVAASEAASLRKQIEAMSKAGREITRSIKSRGEMKYVHCEPRKERSPNLPQAVVEKLGLPPAGEMVLVTYRLDTQEAISWRALKPIEKQGQLFGDAAPTKSQGVEVRTSLGDKLKEAGVTS